MSTLKDRFEEKAAKLREEVKNIREEYADKVIGDIKVGQVYAGMKGMIGLVYETSSLDPAEGIRFRGYSIPELREKLPKAEGGVEPLPEGIFYLMLMNELPSEKDVKEVSRLFREGGTVPPHVFKMLDSLPTTIHPMTQFSLAILAMQSESVFAEAYRKGVSRYELWKYMFDDVINLIGRLPRVAAYIYRRTYKDGKHIEPDDSLDWAANFAHMLGYGNNAEFKKLMRLYLTIHADHEGGNVSAHTTRLVGSALSDAYYSFSAAMDGLAGPLHGLANQEVIRWILDLQEELGGGVPSRQQIEEYVHRTLDAGRVIPGYGHAVLRKTDPRFTAQHEFAKEYMPEDDLVKIVSLLYEVVPGVLKETGKIKNPWPNVDAHSGALLVHYGMKEYDFYTVMFGVSRALGVLASLIWDRALGLPLERPKSVTTKWITENVK
ncbi:MAG: citrate (Si)-synthase, eukaryotic [Bacteroidia bacterium]